MELTRKQVIEILEKADSTVYKEPKTKTAQALEYAISFLKTDEGVEVYDKDTVLWMFRELQLEIEEREQYYKDKFLEPSNAVHDAAMGGRMFGCGDCKEIIQQKINKLKENKDGNNTENT